MTELMLERSIIKWRCRRGMLELDLFLIPFYENQFENLNTLDKKNFIQLLEENDVNLYQWLMGYAHSDNADFVRIIQIIRSYKFGENS